MGNPFVHIELAADDVAAAKKFYKSVFSWKLKDMKMGGGMVYTTIDPGGGTGGGMSGKMMPQQPTAWTSYVGVDSVKKTLAKAAKAGAQIVQDYMEVGMPGKPPMGALGIFIDPQGAPVGLWQQIAAPPAPAKAGAKKTAAKKKAAPKKKAAKKK